MITILKVLLTIILIPLKIVYFLFAYTVQIIIWIIIMLSPIIVVPLEFLNKLISPILIISAIGIDIFLIYQITTGNTPITEGIFLMVGISLTSTVLILLVNVYERLSEALLRLGNTLTDWAKANWFAFW